MTRVTAFFVTIATFSLIEQFQRLSELFLGHYLSLDDGIIQSMFQNLEINGTYILACSERSDDWLIYWYYCYIIMSAIQIAGGFIDFQMGFAIANVIDPQTGAQSPLLGQFFNSLALLLLLALNGHHLLLDGIFYSYQFMPMDQFGQLLVMNDVVEFVIKTFVDIICNCISNVDPNCRNFISCRFSTWNYGKNSSTIEYFCCRVSY